MIHSNKPIKSIISSLIEKNKIRELNEMTFSWERRKFVCSLLENLNFSTRSCIGRAVWLVTFFFCSSSVDSLLSSFYLLVSYQFEDTSMLCFLIPQEYKRIVSFRESNLLERAFRSQFRKAYKYRLLSFGYLWMKNWQIKQLTYRKNSKKKKNITAE